jgi:urease accessory protein
MRTRVHVVAAADAGGRTHLTTLSADGQLAARATRAASSRATAARVHLVGAAAGPMGGDEVVVVLEVGPGAVLELRSAAAAIALPGGAGDGATARARTEITVAAGGRLDVACEPTVVCAGAALIAGTAVEADAGAEVRITERTVLGRHGEAGGTWTGRSSADVAGEPVLRATLDSDLLGAGGARAVVTVLALGPTSASRAAAAHRGPPWAVLTPLATRGWSATAWASDVGAAGDALARVIPAGAAALA